LDIGFEFSVIDYYTKDIEEIDKKNKGERQLSIPLQILGYWVQFVNQYLTLLLMTWEEGSEEALEVLNKHQDPLVS
jgi:hypothetical protein